MIRTLAAFSFVAAAGALSICPLCGAGNGARKAAVGPVAAYAAVTSVAPVVAQVPAASIASGVATSVVTLKITGMTCGGCVLGVRKVLTRLNGVTEANVSYEKGSAVITFDPAKARVEQMIAAIRTLGYTAVVAG